MAAKDCRLTGFDFTAAVTALCEDITSRSDAFLHIDMSRVFVAFAQARRRTLYGLQAKLTPLRFEDGSLYTRRQGRQWTVQRVYSGGREMLYILTFYLPRFQDNMFREKLITVFHELYHISPQFNGDIRRMQGRYHVHSHSQQEYDLAMGAYVDEYLASGAPQQLYAFLQHDFESLTETCGTVYGNRIPIPKLIPINDAISA